MRGLEEVEFDALALEGADPDGLFLVALRHYPYMMTPKQVADFLGLTPQGIRKLLSSGDMAGCHIGTSWRIPKLCLLRYLYSEQRGRPNEESQMRQTNRH